MTAGIVDRFVVVPASYVFFLRDDRVLLQLRQNTGFMDDHWAAAAAGHVEQGETAQDAAVREVEEETGIRGTVIAALGTIDYWFVAENRRVHKTVHHYLLVASGGELSDEDIEVDEVAWVPLDELGAHLAYAGERRLAETAAGLLADTA